MSDDKNTLCEMKKERLMKEFEFFRSLVLAPQYACRKCGRVSKDAKWLCKPISLNPKKS